jgi:hypothetical protein
MSIYELLYERLTLPNVLLDERMLRRRGSVFVVLSVFTTLLLEPLAGGLRFGTGIGVHTLRFRHCLHAR